MKDIIEKLKEAGLKGRGGAGFPTATKWELVKKAKGKRKYVVCNASEGEPNVFKDGYIIEKYSEELVSGINLAMKAIGADKAYIYLNKDYYKKFKGRLEEAIGKRNIIIFEKKARLFFVFKRTLA